MCYIIVYNLTYEEVTNLTIAFKARVSEEAVIAPYVCLDDLESYIAFITIGKKNLDYYDWKESHMGKRILLKIYADSCESNLDYYITDNQGLANDLLGHLISD